MDEVWKEPAPDLPHWIRGREEAFVVEPVKKKMATLAFGSSVATPNGQALVAEAVVVENFDELYKLDPSQVSGKIVVYNQGYSSYGESREYRYKAAPEAAKLGAVAALVESIGPFSINSPHTGVTQYEDGVEKIPSIAITKEDAEMLRRIYRRGQKIVLSIKSNSTMLSPVTSHNLVADYKGSEYPDKVVVVSGHIDNWDVGQGAMDDAGGMMLGLIAVEVINNLGLPRPKRTIRNILWTAEEQGLLGAEKYFNQHQNELNNFVFVMESDSGTFDPQGLQYTGDRQNGECIIKEIVSMLAPINASKYEWTSGAVSTDITHFTDAGVPGAGLWDPDEIYFYFHHTEGDMMTVEDPDALDRAVALWTATAYIIADLNSDFPRSTSTCLYSPSILSLILLVYALKTLL
ncbi:hypothetical protein QYM36_002952 [Artemia franciscana]|nr:hypothetical protein QYM36_002952 [Artemia franciscana]KAK2722585.1 hypothetical protein QYM36_002952 [Artemia franciscana]